MLPAPGMARAALAAALVALVSSTTAPSSASAATTVTCDRVAATTGSDSAAGTAAAPFRTAQRLADDTPAGGTGCLRAGTFVEDVDVSHPDVTLTSFPGERATLKGRLWIKQGADRVTVSRLNIDGKNAALLPSPTVNADDAHFVADDVTNEHTEICFILGSASWGRAHRTVIQGNRIHDCGRIPSSNQDHGIYVAAADDTQIVDNVIYANVDRGVQLYPNAQRTVIRGNVIDGNGEGIIFSGADGTASSETQVTQNIISNSRLRSNVESWYPAGNVKGTSNVVTGNCIAGGSIDTSGGGFTASANVSGDPLYAGAAQGDFTPAAGSACGAVLAGSTAPTAGWGDGTAPAPALVPRTAPVSAPAPDPVTAADPAPAADPVAAPAPSTSVTAPPKKRVAPLKAAKLKFLSCRFPVKRVASTRLATVRRGSTRVGSRRLSRRVLKVAQIVRTTRKSAVRSTSRTRCA